MPSYTPPQDTPTVKYSRYDRFKAVVSALADITADAEVEPQNDDQFKDLEERFWNALVEVALLASSGAGGSGSTATAANLTTMRAIVSSSTNQVCFLLGEASAYDGGGGFYAWEIDPTSAAVDAPMTDVVPDDRASAATGDKGYWKKFA